MNGYSRKTLSMCAIEELPKINLMSMSKIRDIFPLFEFVILDQMT